MDIPNPSKVSQEIVSILISSQRDRRVTFGSVLYSLSKILEAAKIGASLSKGAFEVVQVHTQVVEDVIFAHSNYFDPNTIKAVARVKTRWDKEMLRNNWEKYIGTAEYQGDIKVVSDFVTYIEHRIFFEPIRNILLVGLGIGILIAVAFRVFN